MEKRILYFEKGGAQNTDAVLAASKERVVELGIKDIVVASTHGGTGLKAAKVFKGMKLNLVAVTISEGFSSEGWAMTREERGRLEKEGVKVLTCTHALGDDVSSAFTEKFGGKAPNEIVTQTLYRFYQGMKVCVEIVLMAADAGLVPVGREVIAVAGTGEGADTAIVAKPSYPRKFLDLEIKEIIAKPR